MEDVDIEVFDMNNEAAVVLGSMVEVLKQYWDKVFMMLVMIEMTLLTPWRKMPKDNIVKNCHVFIEGQKNVFITPSVCKNKGGHLTHT